MAYDEAFKSILVSSKAKLSLELEHLVIQQDKNIAKIFLKDINFIILESLQATLPSKLLSTLATHKIILLTSIFYYILNKIF